MIRSKKNLYRSDLMKGIIVNIRSGVVIFLSVLISLLETLVSKKDVAEKKRISMNEYGMIMTVELERRIQIMRNWSECIKV